MFLQNGAEVVFFEEQHPQVSPAWLVTAFRFAFPRHMSQACSFQSLDFCATSSCGKKERTIFLRPCNYHAFRCLPTLDASHHCDLCDTPQCFILSMPSRLYRAGVNVVSQKHLRSIWGKERSNFKPKEPLPVTASPTCRGPIDIRILRRYL